MSKVFGAITGAGAIEKGTRKAANAAAFSPFSFNGPFGSVDVTGAGLSASGGPGAALTGPLQDFALQSLMQAGGIDIGQLGLSPQDALQRGLGIGESASAAASPFLAGAQNIISGLGNFNIDEFVNTQFDRLSSLARRGEETAAARQFGGLFSRGRLGAFDTASGEVASGLERAQQEARTSRALQAIGLGREELASRLGAAGSLVQTGQGAAGIGAQDLQNFLAAIQGAQGVQAGQANLRGNFLNQAITGTQGISAALSPTERAIANALAGASLTNQQNALRAQIIQGGAAQQGAAVGNFTGSLIGGLAKLGAAKL